MDIFVFSAGVNWGVLIYQAKQLIGWRPQFDWAFWRSLLRRGYPLAISGVLSIIYFSASSLILSVIKPPAEVGIFRLAYKVLESLIFFPAMFAGLIMPLLSRFALGERFKFQQVFQKSWDVLLIFTLPLVAGAALLAQPIVFLLGGRQYSEAAPVLSILMIAVAAIFLSTLFSYALIALGQEKKIMMTAGAAVIGNLLLNIFLLPRYSYLGAAWVTTVTESGVALALVFFLWPIIKNLSFKKALKSFAATVLMVMILWWGRGQNTAWLISGGALFYFLTLKILGGFSWQEVRSLINSQHD